jgi:hypothetical protein
LVAPSILSAGLVLPTGRARREAALLMRSGPPHQAILAASAQPRAGKFCRRIN